MSGFIVATGVQSNVVFIVRLPITLSEQARDEIKK